MGVSGNVFQRGPLEVTSRATQTGRVLAFSVADATGLTQQQVAMLPVDVRELHANLGAWLDAVEQEAVAKATPAVVHVFEELNPIAADRKVRGVVTCIVCGGEHTPTHRYGSKCPGCSQPPARVLAEVGDA